MFRNLNVRTKLMLVLSVPLIAMAGFAGIGAGERLADADRAGTVTALARVVRGQVDLSHQLETERLWTGITQTTDGALGRAQLAEQRTRTDAALTQYRRRARAERRWPRPMSETNDRLADLASVRSDVDDDRVAADVASDRYDRMITVAERSDQGDRPRGQRRRVRPADRSRDRAGQAQVRPQLAESRCQSRDHRRHADTVGTHRGAVPRRAIHDVRRAVRSDRVGAAAR